MKTRTILLVLMLMLSISIYSQRSVFEDDIYYSPKSNKTVKEVTKVETTTTTTSTPVTTTVLSSNDMDVDAYNRRYSSDYSVEGTTQEQIQQTTTTTTTTQTYYVNGVGGDGMEYAERIRRFHNPEIGLYVVDPEYNNIYLIDDDYTPYISSINIITTPWITPLVYTSWYYNPWRYNSWYYTSWYYNPWRYDPWYWPTAYYPSYYRPRPYPGYRPTPPSPSPSHRPGYDPTPRPNSNHGNRYNPGGSVGTGGRTDGATRYNGTTAPPRNNQSVSPNRQNNTPKRTTPSYGGRTSSGGSNKGTSTSGGSFTRPSNSKPTTTTPSRQSYSPSSSGRSGMSSGSSIKSSSGRSVGGRGSR